MRLEPEAQGPRGLGPRHRRRESLLTLPTLKTSYSQRVSMPADALSVAPPWSVADADPAVRASVVARLAAAARGGSSEAWAELYTRFGAMVHGILIARVERADVSDLVHDVFTHAIGKLHTLREPAAFGGWLATIARNRAVDYARQRPRTQPLHDAAERIADTNTPDETARVSALSVLAIIRRLPDAYRDTLALRLVEGMTGPEIAEATGLSPGSVRVNLHRGMKLLRQRLEGSVGHE